MVRFPTKENVNPFSDWNHFFFTSNARASREVCWGWGTRESEENKSISVPDPIKAVLTCNYTGFWQAIIIGLLSIITVMVADELYI